VIVAVGKEGGHIQPQGAAELVQHRDRGIGLPVFDLGKGTDRTSDFLRERMKREPSHKTGMADTDRESARMFGVIAQGWRHVVGAGFNLEDHSGPILVHCMRNSSASVNYPA